MPTGYTAKVQDGEITTLRDFALTCARAFGALIMMRDDPIDAPIPRRFEPNLGYHEPELAKAKALLEELPTLSTDECDRRARAEFDAAMSYYTKSAAERSAQKRRYEKMLDKVETWRVPDDLRSLREFMIEQLRTSIDHDCNNERYRGDPPIRLTGEAWRTKTLERASRDVAYHTVKIKEEIDRMEGRNKWLAQLFEALPPAEPEPRGFV